MSMVSLTIDGKKVTVPAGTTILEAAKAANIRIPTLCYLPEVQAIGACRVCLVEIEGNRNLQASCVFPVADGLSGPYQLSKKVHQARKFTVELLLSAHPQDCLICVKNRKCELQKLAEELGIREVRFQGEKPKSRIDESNSLRPQGCEQMHPLPAVCDRLPGNPAGRSALRPGTGVRYLHRAGLRG